MVIDLLLAGTVHFPFVCCSCLFCPFTFCFWMFSFLSFAFDVFSLFIVCFYCFDMCPTHLTFYHCFVHLPVAVNMFSCGGGAELSMPLAISKTNIVYTFPFACHYPFIILSFLFMFKTSKHRLLHQVCHISLHIYIYIYIITILFVCTLFAEMFFHVSSQKKKQLPHYFSSLIIQFHYCNLRSLFLICPHNCSKKKRLHHVFISFWRCSLSFCFCCIFAETKRRYIFFLRLILSAHIFWSLFSFSSHMFKCSKKRGYTICSILFWKC